jgi:hypothetical protein
MCNVAAKISRDIGDPIPFHKPKQLRVEMKEGPSPCAASSPGYIIVHPMGTTHRKTRL